MVSKTPIAQPAFTPPAQFAARMAIMPPCEWPATTMRLQSAFGREHTAESTVDGSDESNMHRVWRSIPFGLLTVGPPTYVGATATNPAAAAAATTA